VDLGLLVFVIIGAVVAGGAQKMIELRSGVFQARCLVHQGDETGLRQPYHSPSELSKRGRLLVGSDSLEFRGEIVPFAAIERATLHPHIFLLTHGCRLSILANGQTRHFMASSALRSYLQSHTPFEFTIT
jgi:hypothetical protein